MAAYDERALALAARMLAPKPKGKGQAIILQPPPTGGDFDEATDTTFDLVPSDPLTGSGIEGEAYSAFSIAQGVVAAGDVRFLLSPVLENGQPTPQPAADTWTAMLGGEKHTIKEVKTTQPAGLPVLFELRLRR